MQNERELLRKLSGVRAVQGITKAMEMIAASKLRHSQERMRNALPYAQAIRTLVRRLAKNRIASGPVRRYFQPTAMNKVGYWVVSSRQGLCGGLNAQLFRTVLEDARRHRERGSSLSLALFGTKAIEYFGRFRSKFHVLAQNTAMGSTISFRDILGPCGVMLRAYQTGDLDTLFIASNRFHSTALQQPQLIQLLPFAEPESDWKEDEESPEEAYLYEPDPESILLSLLPRTVETLIYQSVLENLACEQAARMIAMQTASDSADGLIEDLTLQRHRIRQANVTQELTEIIAGASVIEDH